MSYLYSGSIEVERILKANLPAKDSGDKWYFVVEDVDSTKGELWCTNSNGIPIQIGNAAGVEQALQQINVLSNITPSVTLESIDNPKTQYLWKEGCIVDTVYVDGDLRRFVSRQIKANPTNDTLAFRTKLYDMPWQPWQQIATTKTIGLSPYLANGWEACPWHKLEAVISGKTVTLTGMITGGTTTHATKIFENLPAEITPKDWGRGILVGGNNNKTLSATIEVERAIAIDTNLFGSWDGATYISFACSYTI